MVDQARMENQSYVFDAPQVMGPRVKKSPLVQIEKDLLRDRIDGEGNKKALDSMQERADNLIGAQGTSVIPEAVRVIQNRNYARQKTLENDYYRFIMQVSGFSNEPIEKLWNQTQKKDEQPLLSGPNSLAFEANANTPLEGLSSVITGKTGNYNEQTINRELRNRGDFLRSAEVAGQFFLSPSAYSHMLEAWEIVRHRCNTDVDLDTLVSVEHSTYYARLVAIRIQISRFLAGRYYNATSNYRRLLSQQEHLITGYFKSKFSSGQRLQGNPYFQALQAPLH